MTTTSPTTTIDEQRLMGFVFRAVDEIGATLNTALVVMGDRLGYYRALVELGPTTPAELAARTDTESHYAREWLDAQAAGGIVDYDPATGRYTLPAEHAVALTDETSPAYLPGFFQIAHGTVADAAHIIAAARSGGGMGWHEHNADVHVGCERFFRPGYAANLVSGWLPALEGVTAKLSSAGTSPTSAAATARPRSSWRRPTRGRGSSARTTTPGPSRSPAPAPRRRAWPTACASRSRTRPRSPAAATTWSRCSTACTTWATRSAPPATSATAIADDGTWMVVEPPRRATGSRTTSTRSGGSTTASRRCCARRPRCRSRSGSRWAHRPGPPASSAVTAGAGFSRFAQVAETPFNMVLEVRP